MRTVLLVTAGALLSIAWSASLAQPRLAVVVVVDQMRTSYLEDFAHDFGHGFGRLREQGSVFINANHDHALTETAAGNVTIVTGTYPSRHGVVGNDIWDRHTRQLRGAVLDSEHGMVGAVRRSGRSPWRMLRSTVGDWLKQQSPESKVFGVSLKDRSAVFLAGQHSDGAYWYDERAGNFVTSDFYRDALPDWVERFNAAARVDDYFARSWTRLFAKAHYSRGAAVERGSAEDYPPFPHVIVGDDTQTPDRRFYGRFRLTPFSDLVTLEFAQALIEAEQLGADAATDLLAIGLSASDYIGHRYGPLSDEVHDHYARLDGYLGEFLAYLDARIGTDNYTVVLTADHGVAAVPERIAEHGQTAVRIHWDELLAQIEPVIADAHRRGIVSAIPELRYEFGVIFDFGDANVPVSESDALAALVAEELEYNSFVLAAFTHRELREGDGGGSPWFDLYGRSFHPDRAPDVIVHVTEDHLITNRRVGTTHISPHAYDRDVPLIFAGPGIEGREYRQPVRTVDIAPTLAVLLGLEVPPDLDGRDLSPLLRAAD
jgi:predicted AlkP superfamily pyrophosphatase or phosphodiesterase